jgi:mRNA-degrading endonuclease RelE of RelBE toxin-antitoxin system
VAALPYRAALTKSFLRELKKIPEDTRSRILRTVDDILTNPFSGGKIAGRA